MRLANLTTPMADYLVPPAELIDEGVVVENVLLRVEIPLATEPVRLAMKDLVYLEGAMRAEREGYDGVLLNTVADYGIGLMRSVVGIPVVGAGEAAIRTALAIMSPFSIVTVWPRSTAVYYERILDDTASRDRLASVRFVLEEDELGPLGGGAGVMASVHEPTSSVADRVMRVARDAVDHDGARVIVLGCSCMTALAKPMERELGVPVIDPLEAGFLEVQRAARAADGRVVPAVEDDTAARIDAMVAAWEVMGESTRMVWVDDCGDVCATVA